MYRPHQPLTINKAFSPYTMPRTKSYFLSDLHLGATYLPDERCHEERVVEMLQAMARDAKAVYLLGDVLDYWYEYRTVVPRGHVRFFGQLAAMADAGIRILWFTGNHDIWLFDYLSSELGITVIDGSMVTDIDGFNFFLAHGDGLGDPSFGFKIIRKVFRSRVAQWMFAAIHPRWTVPFAYKWSSHSRRVRGGGIASYKGDDNELPMIFAKKYVAENPDIDYFITGHRHVAVTRPLPGGKEFVILGDCFHQYTYAVFDPAQTPRLQLLRWKFKDKP